MKKLAAFCLLLVISLPAGAVEDGQVMYTGGTVAGIQAGALGRLDTASENTLSFEYSGNKLAIPYAKIASFEYSEVAGDRRRPGQETSAQAFHRHQLSRRNRFQPGRRLRSL